MFHGAWFRLLLFLCLIFASVRLDAQQFQVSGIVMDGATKRPIPFATVYIKDFQIGTVTDKKGKFELSTPIAKPPLALIISGTDYEELEYVITQNDQVISVRLKSTPLVLKNDVVESPSRQPERLLESPVTVEYMDRRMIRSVPNPFFYDAIANLKGTQLNTGSLLFNSANTRGFATFNNGRFVQLIDGMNNAPPGLNFAIGNLVGISELDVEDMELLPGTASVLYGPNAFNGLLYINSMDPFRYKGLSAQVKSGVLLSESGGTEPFWGTSIRLAETIGAAQKLAFKLNFSMERGADWNANDTTDIDLNPINSPFRGPGSPSYDGVNSYGDEIAQTINVNEIVEELTGQSLGLPPIRVARTGYEESFLLNNKVNSVKVGVALHYKLSSSLKLIGSYNYNQGSTIYQGTNRIAFRNVSLSQARLELKNDYFFIRAYSNKENAGDSYDMRFAAWNINRVWKSDLQWFTEYTEAYIAKLLGFGVPPANTPDEAHGFARNVADSGRLEPSDPRFLEIRDSIIQIASLATGSKFIDQSSLFDVDGGLNLNGIFRPVDIQIGGNIRRYKLNSKGTLFNDLDSPISFMEYGTYIQLGKDIFKKRRLKLAGAIRYDKNDNFEANLTYRGSAVLGIGLRRNHNVRVSFQTGFRNPDPPGQFLALDLGVVRSLGGTEQNILNYSLDVEYINGAGNPVATTITGPNVYSNSYSASSVAQFNEAFAQSVAGGTDPGDAIRDHFLLLQPAEIDFIRPEKVTSWEIGYKGLIRGKFSFDLNAFRSEYKDFHTFVNVFHVLSGSVHDLSSLTGVFDLVNGRTSTFELITNAPGRIIAYGGGLGLNYAFRNTFTVGGNYSFHDSQISHDANPDRLPGINAPRHKVVFSFGSYNLAKSNLGFQINWRWLEGYFWKARFASGPVESFNVLDFQINYQIPSSNLNLKIGATNLLNKEYRQAIGTPYQGSVYFLSLTFNGTKRFSK